MKNEIIAKVNKIGKAGYIITKIAGVILSIGFVVAVMGAVILAVMPKDFVSIKMSGDAAVEIDVSRIPFFNTEDFTKIEDFKQIGVEIESELEFNGVEYDVISAEQKDGVFVIDAKAESYTVDISIFKWLIFIALLDIVVAFWVIRYISKLCKTFQNCETPFTQEIASGLKKLAISIIPMAFLSTITEAVAGSIMTGDVNVTIGVDVMTIVLVMLIFMLSAIFNYGTMLQQESDETL